MNDHIENFTNSNTKVDSVVQNVMNKNKAVFEEMRK